MGSRTSWDRAREWAAPTRPGSFLLPAPAPTRYLRRFDLQVRALQTGRLARLWIGPDVLRVEGTLRLRAIVDRREVVATGWGRPTTAGRRLHVVTGDGTRRAVCRASGSAVRFRIDGALALAGWPTDTPPPVDHRGTWWAVARYGRSTGWLVVEPEQVGIETPAAVAWWPRRVGPSIRVHDEEGGLRVEIRAGEVDPLVVVVPRPGSAGTVAALESGGWLGRG